MISRKKTDRNKSIASAEKARVSTGGMAGYSGTPLPKKLGVGEASRVVFVNPPERFERKLEPMPASAEVSETASLANVAILFVKSEAELIRDFRALAKLLPKKVAFWIAWPKQASGIKTDLKEGIHSRVRARPRMGGLQGLRHR